MVENSRDQAGVGHNQSVGQPEETGFPNTQKKANTSTGPGQDYQLQGGGGCSSDPQKKELHNFEKAASKSTGGFDSAEEEDLDEIDEFRKENDRETKE